MMSYEPETSAAPSPATYRDDYPSCEQTYVTLCVYELDPAVVSEALGLQPDKVRVKGERWKTRAGWSSVPARVSGWFFGSKGQVDSKDVRRHLDWLLDQIEPHAAALKSIQAAGGRMTVSCYWSSAWGHGGPTLSPSIMSRLADLGLEIWFDVYVSEQAAEEDRADTGPPAGQ
jgi:hypothetical protein